MKALRALRALTALSSKPHPNATPLAPLVFRTLCAAPSHADDSESGSESVFDSSHYAAPGLGSGATAASAREPSWDEKYRARAEEAVFGKKSRKRSPGVSEEKEEEERRRVLAKALLEAALAEADDEDGEAGESVVKEEDQRSVSVGIVGAPNAGKSALTNYVVRFCFD